MAERDGLSKNCCCKGGNWELGSVNWQNKWMRECGDWQAGIRLPDGIYLRERAVNGDIQDIFGHSPCNNLIYGQMIWVNRWKRNTAQTSDRPDRPMGPLEIKVTRLSHMSKTFFFFNDLYWKQFLFLRKISSKLGGCWDANMYVYANRISIYICKVQLNIHNIDIKVSQAVSQSVIFSS